ncbi:lipocalin-like domain-containing protein [Rheinheimera mangrovi]|uniref:lipocalin-like domain-containing protein n=1 Tax=Rheinheimera mangrovi TaxID=2498451 RepID=UPI000F8EB0D9|nr:lipocalin-like domain-containing protein [Rheinheimera mangrovi]
MSKFSSAILCVLLTFSLSAFAKETSPLVGAWRMVKLEVLVDGKLQSIPYTGQLIVTDAGTLSAQAMDANPKAAPTPFTANGYEALYGKISIDDSLNQFEVEIQSSLVRDLIGKKMQRKFEVTAEGMILSPLDEKEGWRVTYDRY